MIDMHIDPDRNTITWKINHNLCFDNIMLIEQKALTFYAQFTKNNQHLTNWILLLDANKSIDSAGLSWLLLLQSRANSHHLSLKIIGLNENKNATELAKAQGVYNLLV
ncbi:hypothetical protein L3V82_02355 [Thiotrichales bacterium 19S3-7]|nr:hypothetical protein [Thiotrichales bacterium 19S3-7]MCF6801009.1 hypothetical protein [Thiotrichales bacterium 19S3-11]